MSVQQLSPDSTLLAIGTDEGMVRVLRSISKQQVFSGRMHIGPVRVMQWSPDGRVLATGGADGTIAIWRGADTLERIARDVGEVSVIAWQNNETLAVASGSHLNVYQVGVLSAV